MQKSALLMTLLFLATAPFALAQEAPNSHTLDEQLQNVKAGKPAVPLGAPGSKTSTGVKASTATPASTSSGLSHTASPLAPKAAVSAAAPATTTAYDKYGQPINSGGSGAIPALPLQEMISGEIHFITGGVGDEEVDQLKSAESQYNFHLLITAGQGEYLSECTLRLHDAKGVDVLATGNAGPYFYARLNPGTYMLDITTAQGSKQSVPLKITPNTVLKKTVQFNV
jgi:hypothetical protein